MILRSIVAGFALACLFTSHAFSDVVPYIVNVSNSEDGSVYSATMNIDTDTANFVDDFATNLGIFFNPVSDLEVSCVAADGTVRNFVSRIETVNEDGTVDLNGNGDMTPFGGGTFEGVPDVLSSMVCVTDFAGDETDAFPAADFGLPADFTGLGMLLTLLVVDETGDETLLTLGVACGEATTQGALPTENLDGDCVGYGGEAFIITSTIQPSTADLIIGDVAPSVNEQISEIYDTVVELFVNGDISYSGAAIIATKLSFASFFYENGFENLAILKLWKARQTAIVLIYYGQLDPTAGTALIDDIEATIQSILDA